MGDRIPLLALEGLFGRDRTLTREKAHKSAEGDRYTLGTVEPWLMPQLQSQLS